MNCLKEESSNFCIIQPYGPCHLAQEKRNVTLATFESLYRYMGSKTIDF